jgi:Cytochrome P450
VLSSSDRCCCQPGVQQRLVPHGRSCAAAAAAESGPGWPQPQSTDAPRAGRWLAKQLAGLSRGWQRRAARRMPQASGDIREIVNEPFFVPLYSLFRSYGAIFKLCIGPQTFVVISDPMLAKQVLVTNAAKYSKGILSEILEFVMGQGLIPADGEVWKTRRRCALPSSGRARRALRARVRLLRSATLPCQSMQHVSVH